MDLWLLRHAEAEDRAASGRDEDRDLTAGGLAHAGTVARGLAALEPGIRFVLSSPYRRALQTAGAAAKAMGLTVRTSGALVPGQDPEEILTELDRLSEESVLLVGHAPQLGLLLGRLVTGSAEGEIPLSKAAVARVSVNKGGREGRLKALLPPGIFERLSN